MSEAGSGDVRLLVERALDSVEAAITTVDRDAEASLDDLAAARLLLATALATMQNS